LHHRRLTSLLLHALLSSHDATSLQIFLLCGIVLAFFLLTTSLSPYVHLGLYDRYLKQHGGVFTLCLLSVLLVGSIGAYRLVRVCAAHQLPAPAWPGLHALL
jgi:hypothetical protein